MAKRFKRHVARISVQYMVEAYGPSRIVWQGDNRKEGERYLYAVFEALERVIKSNFWI